MGTLGGVWRPLIASWVADEHLVPKDRNRNTRWSKAAASPGVSRTQRPRGEGLGCGSEGQTAQIPAFLTTLPAPDPALAPVSREESGS